MTKKIFITWLVVVHSFIVSGQSKTITLFDGQTLNGWLQVQETDASLSGGDIFDIEMFVKMLLDQYDPVSAFINTLISDEVKATISSYSAEKDRDVRSALIRELNSKVVSSGIPLYDRVRFMNIPLRRVTKTLLDQNPKGYDLARLNKLLIEDAYPSVLHKMRFPEWVVNSKSGAMASIGASRGVIYTEQNFSGRYRIIFSIRHLGSTPGAKHQAGVLIFCQPPAEGEKPLGALGAIQFQVPLGYTWDYRPGKNNSGKDLFTLIERPNVNIEEWSRVELLIDADKGTARMAVSQPVDAKAIEVLRFEDPTAARVGPFGLQTHNAGLFDEYKDITVELNPEIFDLITTK